MQTNGNNVTVSVRSEVPAAVSKLMGVDTIPIEAKSEAGTSGRKLEVSMMIDLTGSMSSTRGGMSKIAALKLAANDMMDMLFPNGATTSGQVKVAIAPMADYVNAGPYAPIVTGLASSGPYAKLTNLKNTKNGPFSGNYSGTYGNSQPLGSQAGATPLNASVVSGQVSGATPGQTYSSAHCLDPMLPSTPIQQMTYSNTGIVAGFEITGSGAKPAQVFTAGWPGFYKVNAHDNTGNDQGWEYFSGSDSDGVIGNNANDPNKITGSNRYYVPLPASVTGVEYLRDASSGKLIGIPAYVGVTSGVYPQIKKASNEGGYKKITGFSNGNFNLQWSTVNSGYFIPVPVQTTVGGGISPNCTGTDSAPDQNAGALVSCVTERTTSDRYTDAAPSGGNYVGPYNQVAPGKTTNKLNYSEDGKCYTAGRELPEIIPLTNDRSKIDALFSMSDSQLIGGATPGHLGHAWAWYMLSPEWNDVWPLSAAVPYDDAITKKYAIIMTDGEYNTQYASTNSVTQARALCDGMKAKGIHVITVGFGFSADPEGTSAGNMLQYCASDAGSFFWPYDADQLRQTFKDIGTLMLSGTVNLVVMK